MLLNVYKTYLVDCDRANFEVLFPNEHFNGPLVSEVVLEQILALTALELTAENVQSLTSQHESGNLPPLRVSRPIMPGNRAFLQLDMASCRALKFSFNDHPSSQNLRA